MFSQTKSKNINKYICVQFWSKMVEYIYICNALKDTILTILNTSSDTEAIEHLLYTIANCSDP